MNKDQFITTNFWDSSYLIKTTDYLSQRRLF